MKISRFSAISLALAFAIIMTGCHHNTPVAKTNTTQPPKITSPSPTATLKVTPDTVDKGQSAELSWSTQNAATVTIDGIGSVSASGSRRITPASSTTYHLSAQGDGGNSEASARITVNIPDTTSKLTDEQLFEQNIKDIFFNYDNFDIRQDETQIASADADFLSKHPNIKLRIEGHCDERGSEDYNMGLGENRATAVKQLLEQHGVSPDRIKIISFGKEKPFCTAAENESCWQQNRRAHFVFSN
ncbi:MAG TPA: peptidoglycan-associated lipoprotein Pal [Candidatus Angelobacter sp.]